MLPISAEYRHHVKHVRRDDKLLHLPRRRRNIKSVGLALHLCGVLIMKTINIEAYFLPCNRRP